MLPLPSLTVNVFVLMVEDCITSLNVAVMILLIATPVAPLTGLVEMTVGAIKSPVLKPQVWSKAIALPAKSLTPVVILAVYVVESDRLLDGVNVAVVPLYETVPLMLPLLSLTVNVFVLIEEDCIASLNMAVIVLLIATPAAPLTGIVEMTIGGVISTPPTVVVKLHV